MSDFSLHAISPIDGRYHAKTRELSDYMSEAALMKYRVLVEVEYLIALCDAGLPELQHVDRTLLESLRARAQDFSQEDAAAIKDTEKTTNHDVKAVEYFVKDILDLQGLGQIREFVHFGLTSQDINNTAIPLSLKEAIYSCTIPSLDDIIVDLKMKAEAWKQIPMLARTHGQPASPTRLGKEICVFIERLEEQRRQLIAIPYSAKFGGATGNFNAHHAAYPEVDWVAFANHFVNDTLGLRRSQTTTQIEHYDNLASVFDCLRRINTILLDLCRDLWTYISMEYFRQRIKDGEVGSSAMPHKVNPIDFENAEGNLGLANAIYGHLSEKLPISRLQRDLTDSTALRNIGVPLAHSLLAFKSILSGLGKLIVNESAIRHDLDHNWAVIAEGIQTILRRYGYPNPYEALKALTRTSEGVNERTLKEFIDGLKVPDPVKEKLRALSPHTYTGI
jgi:adenylosuccinate lyase